MALAEIIGGSQWLDSVPNNLSVRVKYEKLPLSPWGVGGVRGGKPPLGQLPTKRGL